MSSLEQTLSRSDPARTSQNRVANIISISSGKGGVGKTWFTISLCHAMAKGGARVLLFDGDLGLANVDVQLGLLPRVDLSAVLAGNRSLKSAVTRFEAGGFDVIAGQSGSGALATVSRRRLRNLQDALRGLARDYDFVVMDLGAGVDHVVQTMMSVAATNFVVTTDEPTALTDAYALIKLLSRAGAAEAVQIVVNMAAHTRGGQLTYRSLLKACDGFLGLNPPLAGVIRRDAHVPDAIRRQMSVFTRHPTCDAASDIAAIAGKIGSKT